MTSGWGRQWFIVIWLLALLPAIAVPAGMDGGAAVVDQTPRPSTETNAGTPQAPDQGSDGEAPQPPPERPAARVKIEISGVEGELLENVQAFLTLYRKREDPRLTDLWVKRLHRKAVEEIQQSLQPFGYYNVKVKGSLDRQPDGEWLASYRITPGPRVKITRVDLKWLGEGADEPVLQAALKKFPLKAGDFLDHKIYEDGKTALMDAADMIGYVDVEPKVARVLVDPKANTASIQLHIDTGALYHIADIRLHQDVLDADFVERYLVDVKPGDVYSQAKLLEIQNSLVEAGYFSLVDVNPRFGEAKAARVPVDVTLTPAKRQTFSIGIGYDTDVGLNLIGRWAHRRLNRRGHKADASMRLSLKENYLRANYWIPIRDPRTTKLGFSVALENENTDTSERNTLDLEAGYYLLWHDWISELFVQFKYEQFVAGDRPTENTTLLSIGGIAEKSAFEEGIYPRRGWGLHADLRGSPGLISSTAYLRGWTHGRVYLPIGEKGRFNLRGELGMAWVSDYDKYPNSLRFFAGGDNSVRGWNWKQLGPKDENGDVIGGKDVITFSVEYDHRVAEQWVAAGFIDGGNAFDDTFSKLYYGAGFGGRWLSPVGAVRLDLAWPFNKDDGDTRFGDIHVHFGFEVNL